MFVLAKTHAAIVAQLENLNADQALLIAKVRYAHKLTTELLQAAEQRNNDLRRQLAVFTAPRARNAKGHFISAKGASA